MGKLIPTIKEVEEFYKAGVEPREKKWEGRTTAAAPIWETAAKSDEAEANYATGTALAVEKKLRLRGLEPWTAADFANAVKGMARFWKEKALARSPKYAWRFKPYLDKIREIVPGLAPKIPGKPEENVINRVVPIAVGLHELKVGGGSPSPSPGGKEFKLGEGLALPARPGVPGRRGLW